MDFAGAPWVAARLWQAVVFGSISGALLWTIGLTRAHGGLAAAAALAVTLLAGGWGPALLLVVSLVTAGAACRLAGARETPPVVPVRLGAASVAAITAVAVAVVWLARLWGGAAYASVALTGALAGALATWWHLALSPATERRPAADAAALAIAFLLASSSWSLGLLGPGDGILPVVGAAVALPVARRIRRGPRRESLVGALLAAAVAVLLALLLP